MRGRRWRPLFVSVVMSVAWSLVATALTLGVRRWWGGFPIFAIEVAGESMTPAFLPGDYLMMRRTSLRPGEAAAGLPPSEAVVSGTGTEQCRSSPSRSKMSCCLMRISM